MRHALVVGGSVPVGFAMEQRLHQAGFGSIDLVHDIRDACRLAATERFELVVVLRGAVAPSRTELLALAQATDAPVLVAANDPLRGIDCLERHPRLRAPQEVCVPASLNWAA